MSISSFNHLSLNPIWQFVTAFSLLVFLFPTATHSSPPSLAKGNRLPNARLIQTDGSPFQLQDLKGRVKILSMVPQLNTPVCDEQTHRFSEKNGGLDQLLDLVTISTNSSQDQASFAEKANIHNLTFLSDSPDFDFGKKTGLLLPDLGILHRAVLVADQENVIRYVELVPMSQLPNFDRVFDAARIVLKIPSP